MVRSDGSSGKRSGASLLRRVTAAFIAVPPVQLHANHVLDCTTTTYYSHNFWLAGIILHGSGGEGNVLAVKFSIIWCDMRDAVAALHASFAYALALLNIRRRWSRRVRRSARMLGSIGD